ncbi:MAG: AAA family ATPase [Deltaproteobacteria bacterium]|jgi:nitrogenase iron protein NifH|nr:AAA family ATPase [Deltaproteobacteria bacterium]MBW2537016.1 AAA family ATPase [Deltaproteobacteria bacterium]
MRQIAIYGKGGIGKSTVVTNVAAALASMNRRVLQVGCDPKRDSTRAHLRGKRQGTLLDMLRDAGAYRDVARKFVLDDFIEVGTDGVHCVEAGGPEPGVGCAGRGIIVTIETLRELGVYDRDYEIIFYDVLGDVVCGGFAMPIREGFAEEIYLVVSGEFLALYAANNICRGIARYASGGRARLAGLIGNLRNVPNEAELIEAFAEALGTRVVHLIPRSDAVTRAENARQTVIEHAPDSDLAQTYRDIATKVLDNDALVIPAPLDESRLDDLVFSIRSGC